MPKETPEEVLGEIPEDLKLTMEQEFAILGFNQKVDLMTLEQSRYFLKHLHRLFICRSALFNQLLRHHQS